MPEYLKTSSKQNSNKPRIISEVKKNCLSKLKLSFTTSLQDFGKSKFTGKCLTFVRKKNKIPNKKKKNSGCWNASFFFFVILRNGRHLSDTEISQYSAQQQKKKI